MKNELKLMSVAVFCFVSSHALTAQDLERSVIASAGASHHSNLEWTLGELAVLSLGDARRIEQGFHHGTLITTAIYEVADNFNLKVYPNPVTSTLSIEHDYDQDLKYEILDMQSRRIMEGDMLYVKDNIDVTKLMPGIYFLRVSDENQPIKILKIIKN